MGTAGGSGSGPRTWDTLAQPAETHPRTHNLASTQLTSRKKANFGLLAGLDWLTGLAGLAADPGTARGPVAAHDGVVGALAAADCAVGSG